MIQPDRLRAERPAYPNAGYEMPPSLAMELADGLLATLHRALQSLLNGDCADATTTIDAAIVHAEARLRDNDCPHCGKPADTNVCGIGGCPMGGDL